MSYKLGFCLEKMIADTQSSEGDCGESVIWLV